ncbi:MAG TPA: hypothetical protein VEC76_19760 [Streptosporangiaceae bacterium]|nr:hypothetical protein [Streptosporangiaceae bacterium]
MTLKVRGDQRDLGATEVDASDKALTKLRHAASGGPAACGER